MVRVHGVVERLEKAETRATHHVAIQKPRRLLAVGAELAHAQLDPPGVVIVPEPGARLQDPSATGRRVARQTKASKVG